MIRRLLAEDVIARTAAGITYYLPQVSEVLTAATDIQVAEAGSSPSAEAD
jgi:hypothetical protein